jgi:hypothetical protein
MHKLPNANIEYLLGNYVDVFNAHPIAPFADIARHFLAELSVRLMKNSQAKRFPDIISFAYWCRRSNIEKIASEFKDGGDRIGRGVVFHIAPSNVPINFAFSYIFGMLAGNANIVRVPSKDFPQTDIIISAIGEILFLPEFIELNNLSCFVRYPQSDEITSYFSSICDARVIWGGDQAIQHLRTIPIPPRAIEVGFSDRYSLCLLDAQAVVKASDNEIVALAQRFFNDAFVFDQNACSSPGWVIWDGEDTLVEEGKKRFWNAVFEIARQRYMLEPIAAIDKFTSLCNAAIDLDSEVGFIFQDNFIYRYDFNNIPDFLRPIELKNGSFAECSIDSLDEIRGLISSRCQTLTYFGVSVSDVRDLIFKYGLKGIDRVVPIGSGLEIGLIWDGYDLIRTLSRIIEFK